MTLFGTIVLIIFIALGLILVIKSYFPLLKSINTSDNDTKNIDTKIAKELTILKTSVDSAEKAAAFVALMGLSYVLVHTLINKGNNYDDQIQCRKFRKSLTPDIIDKINSLEGKYE